MKIYFAVRLFAESERDWIRKVKKEIEELAASAGKPLKVIWPYELLSQYEIDRLREKAKLEIFSRCKLHLDDAEIVIALLDGAQVDDGTALEIGYFSARKSPVRGLLASGPTFAKLGSVREP